MSHADLQQWIQAGDLRRAASSLVVAHGQDVLATCIAMVRDRAAAEDVTQEVFGEAVRALGSFRGESSPRTWLLSIARNRCIDYLRARKRDPWGGALDDGEADPDAHPDEGAPGSEWLADRSVVVRALDALAEGDRALIVLRFKNGLDYGELATAFGLREGTMRMRVSRALARMKEVLENDAVTLPPPPAAPATPAASAASAGALVRARVSAPQQGPAFGGAAPAGAAPSWWTRLREWAGLRQDAEPFAPGRSPSQPVGALGVALTECEPTAMSDALAARLAALVDGIPREGHA